MRDFLTLAIINLICSYMSLITLSTWWPGILIGSALGALILKDKYYGR